MRKLDKNTVYPYNLIMDIVEVKHITNDMILGLEYAMKRHLTEKEQKALRLRYEKKLTFNKLAEKLGISRNSASEYIYRILRKLRHSNCLKYIRYGLEFTMASEKMEREKNRKT